MPQIFLWRGKMGKLGSAKIYGGIGAILMLIGGIIPFVGIIMPIVGLVLLFIAVKYISEEARDESIFKNYLYYFVCNIIAIVAAAALTFVTLGGLSFLSVMHGKGGENPEFAFGSLAAVLSSIIAALVIAWVLLILASIYLRRSYNRIAKHTGVDIFRTTGTVYFIGAATLIILVGAIIIFVAKILEIVAFFSLPEEMPSSPSETMPATTET